MWSSGSNIFWRRLWRCTHTFSQSLLFCRVSSVNLWVFHIGFLLSSYPSHPIILFFSLLKAETLNVLFFLYSSGCSVIYYFFQTFIVSATFSESLLSSSSWVFFAIYLTLSSVAFSSLVLLFKLLLVTCLLPHFSFAYSSPHEWNLKSRDRAIKTEGFGDNFYVIRCLKEEQVVDTLGANFKSEYITNKNIKDMVRLTAEARTNNGSRIGQKMTLT